MRSRMSAQAFKLFRCLVWTVGGLLSACAASAQSGTGSSLEQAFGRPPQAPFITFLGIGDFGKFVTDPSFTPVGPVAQTVYEELRPYETPAGPAGETITAITSTWDEAGHVVEEVRKDRSSETDTTSRYDGDRPVSKESTSPNSKQPKFWNYWVYDKSGKLIEYRRGSGDEIQNHFTKFKRDAQGRLLSYEYHQGPKDELFSRTEFSYSADGKTVDINDYDADGVATQSITETLDEQGRVVITVSREQDWKTKQMKAPLKVTFRYDETGRLIEQNTAAHELEKSGVEFELPPGTVSVVYDDAKHTKTSSYSGDEGSLAYTVTSNTSGATTGVVGGANGKITSAEIHCTEDSHGNWIACQLIAKNEGVEKVTKMWRRKITYR